MPCASQQAILTNDGDLDLLVGKDFGEMFWLENRGSKTRIDWWPSSSLLSSQVHRPWAAPALADLDGDGDIDGLVGGKRGGLWLLRNHGKKNGSIQPLVPEGLVIQDLPMGMRFHPAAADIDKDGDMDVVLAFENGQVLLALNIGIPTLARYVLQNEPLARLQACTLESYHDGHHWRWQRRHSAGGTQPILASA